MRAAMDASELATLYMDTVPRAMCVFRRQLRRGRLSAPQARILGYLRREGPANNRTLAEHQGVSVAAMSRMLDGLARQGLIERLVNARDRRQVRVRLTAAGRRRYEKQRAHARAHMAAHLNRLSVRESEDLRRALGVLGGVVEQIGVLPEVE